MAAQSVDGSRHGRLRGQRRQLDGHVQRHARPDVPASDGHLPVPVPERARRLRRPVQSDPVVHAPSRVGVAPGAARRLTLPVPGVEGVQGRTGAAGLSRPGALAAGHLRGGPLREPAEMRRDDGRA